MNEREALKLALEAFKQIDEAMPFPVAKLAQKAIKEALAQPEQEITDSEMFKIRSAYRKGFEHGMGQSPQRKPPTQDMVESCPYDVESLRGAFFDGWLKAKAAHGIKE